MLHFGGELRRCKRERSVSATSMFCNFKISTVFRDYPLISFHDVFVRLVLLCCVTLNMYKSLQNRKNDEASYEKMLKLRREFSRAITILEMIKRREKTKRELLHLTLEVVEKR